MTIQKDVFSEYFGVNKSIISQLFGIEILYDHNYLQGEIFLNKLQKLYSFLNIPIDEHMLNIINQDQFENHENNYNNILNKFTDLIDKYQKNGDYFNIHSIISNFIHKILDQQKIQRKFKKLITLLDMNYKYIQIDTIINSDDINSSFYLCVDQKCNFFIKKSYNIAVKQEIIDTEIQIIKKSFSDDNLSIPNFVIHLEEMIGSDTYLPYYPFQTLHSILAQINLGRILFNHVDKIVIMKEIAIALNQLHKNGIYHQSLNSSYIFISITKNAYIGCFAHDPNVELIHTKNYPSIFYRDFEMDDPSGPIINSTNIDQENNKNIIYDIYSFGILMYEIITTQNPIELFNGKSRGEIIEILKEHYNEFLFEQFKKIDFDEFYGIVGAKNIIDKCMRKNNNQQYYNFEQIINDIENLALYKTNKKEIENRIKNADDSNSYKCNFSDIVLSYFLGNNNSFKIIKSFLQKFQKDEKYTDIIQTTDYDNLLKIIVNFFELNNQYIDDLNNNLFFQSCFNAIIDEVAFSNIHNTNYTSYFNQSLIKLSKEKNKTPNIIPITSLKQFTNNFHIIDYQMMIYFIAKEISTIHSQKIFHGDLSQDSIGIYFNTETQSFIPAIIPFYIFYACTKEKNKVYYQQSFQLDHIHKMQKKDLKNFLQIVKELDSDLFKMLPNISNISSIDDLVCEIFNVIIKSHDLKYKIKFFTENAKYNYASFQLNFLTIYNIFINYNKNDIIYKVFNYFFNQKETILNLKIALRKIIDFSNEKIMMQDYDIEKIVDSNDIIKLLLKIKENNSIILKISDQLEKERQDEINKKDGISQIIDKKVRSFHLINYTLNEKMHRDKKNKVQMESYISRTLEITELEIKSIKFMIFRYLKTLKPIYNYKITLKLTNKFDSIRQQKRYKLFDLEQIINELHYEYEIVNGTIIVRVDKKNMAI